MKVKEKTTSQTFATSILWSQICTTICDGATLLYATKFATATPLRLTCTCVQSQKLLCNRPQKSQSRHRPRGTCAISFIIPKKGNFERDICIYKSRNCVMISWNSFCDHCIRWWGPLSVGDCYINIRTTLSFLELNSLSVRECLVNIADVT